jgi:predicted dehydrogenase
MTTEKVSGFLETCKLPPKGVGPNKTKARRSSQQTDLKRKLPPAYVTQGLRPDDSGQPAVWERDINMMHTTLTRRSNERPVLGLSAAPHRHIAVIGCGHWGPNHIRTFGGFRNCSVTAVDLDESRRSRIARDFPQVSIESDSQRVLDDPTVDAIVIATPTATHFSLVRAALLAGKHVLCEKPLCTSSREAQELVDLAHSRDLRLMVGHIFLFNPALEEIKRQVESGDLGKLHYLSSVRTNLGPIRHDVNAAFDLAAHDIAIFNWVLNSEPVLVSAVGGAFVQRGIEDVVFVTLRYPDNQLANIHASWLNPKKIRQITFVGSQRMVTWDDLDSSTPVAVYDRGANATQPDKNAGNPVRISMWDGEVRLPKVQTSEPLKEQCRRFLEALDTGAIDRSNGRFSLGVVRVLEAIGTSLRQNGAPVTLSLMA